MSFDWANLVGLVGSAIILAAFAYANAAARFDKLWFNLANLIGAAALLASLWVHFNLAAFVLEAAWTGIALWGVVAALRQRRPVA
jgi:hypothetical protein